jgi:hypothetical protein
VGRPRPRIQPDHPGGGWNDEAVFCRSASRGRSTPGNRFYALGFRLARTVPFVVALPNRTPMLAVPTAPTVVAGQPLAFTVTATDVDPGETLSLTATSLPPGSVFSGVLRRADSSPGLHLCHRSGTTRSVSVLPTVASRWSKPGRWRSRSFSPIARRS